MDMFFFVLLSALYSAFYWSIASKVSPTSGSYLSVVQPIVTNGQYYLVLLITHKSRTSLVGLSIGNLCGIMMHTILDEVIHTANKDYPVLVMML